MTLPSRFELKKNPDAWAALLVALAPFVYFLPAVLGRLFLSPDDGVLFNVPLRATAARIALEGHLPLWNPYLFCGMPLHGAAQAGVLFPLNWFFLAFEAPAATNLMMLSTYAVAALGAYFYARRAGSSVAGALVTSFAYQWSGFLVAQVGHTNVVQVAALLPWLLWALDGYGATGARGRGVLLAAVVALQAFAGHQQTLVYSLLLAAAYALVMSRASRPARTWYLWSLLLLAAGMLLAAVQILPTYELMRNSVRANTSFDFFSSFSLPTQFLLTFFAPYVVGGGDGQLFRAPYTGLPYYGEYIGYVGLLTIMLAALALALRRDAKNKFWAVVALTALALALGRNWPFKLYAVIYYVPVLNLFRVPARHMMEVDFALAVLAGRGLTLVAASENGGRVKRWALGVGACVFLLTCLAVTVGRPAEFRLGREAPVSFLRAPELFLPVALAALSAWALWRFARKGGRRGASLALLAVLVLDLCLWGQSSGWRKSSPRPESELWKGTAPVEFLRGVAREREGGLFRILTVWQSFDPDVPFDEKATPEANEYALQPDPYMMHGIQNAAGYDGFGLARYSRLADDMKVWGDVSDPERSLRGAGREFDLLNVRYLLTRPLVPLGSSARAGAGGSPAGEPSDLQPLPATENYGGQFFASEGLDVSPLERGERLVFEVPRVEADRFALLTNLSWSVDIPDGAQVGSVRLRAEGGRTFEYALRAGEHTSEWAYDRTDIRSRIRHKRAPLATSYAVGDPQGDYEAHTYVASFALPERAVVTGGEISVAAYPGAPNLGLNVARASLSDARGQKTVPLRSEWVTKAPALPAAQAAPTPPTATASATPPQAVATATPSQPTATPTPSTNDSGRWRRVAQAGNVLIYENANALPRAWLAAGAEVLGEQATLEVIRTGRLPGGAAWEPRGTALVEAPLEGFNPSGASAEGSAEVTSYEPNRIEVRTASQAPSILVLGENHYPGWRADVDGRAVETLRVNYNQRGVILPPGAHQVRFVYRPKSVLLGLLLSLLTAAGLALWRFRLLPEERARHIISGLHPRRG